MSSEQLVFHIQYNLWTTQGYSSLQGSLNQEKDPFVRQARLFQHLRNLHQLLFRSSRHGVSFFFYRTVTVHLKTNLTQRGTSKYIWNCVQCMLSSFTTFSNQNRSNTDLVLHGQLIVAKLDLILNGLVNREVSHLEFLYK